MTSWTTGVDLAPRVEEPVRDDRRATATARQGLLQSLAAIAPTLRETAGLADRQGGLADASVQALVSHGFWRMRLCRELGGLELSMVEQIEMLAALAEEDTAAAWCTMVANHAVAVIGSTLPAAAVERVFADGVPRCSIAPGASGSATPVAGGYLVNGHWRHASGLRHADWIHAVARVERDPSRWLPLAIPAADVERLPSADVVGLPGAGAQDFKLNDYFLPAELAGRLDKPHGQVRGVRRYDIPDVEHLQSYEHLAFAIGVARRALRELRDGWTGPSAGRGTADREMVQAELGRAAVQLQAVEALSRSLYDRIDAAALGRTQRWSRADRHLPRALAAWATQLAQSCVQLAFNRSGLAALVRPNIFEKLLRDMAAAAAHTVVNDSAFPNHGRQWVETGAPSASWAEAAVARPGESGT